MPSHTSRLPEKGSLTSLNMTPSKSVKLLILPLRTPLVGVYMLSKCGYGSAGCARVPRKRSALCPPSAGLTLPMPINGCVSSARVTCCKDR